ncbi:hypothetical protein GOBAR_AA30985 [Gossypium barbadense]|uniref:Uncharacterized protein n=1 Tax=Gossypium barbadense TaxID=3634 RepID=A0A2P5WF07_GOSBA|nr:hypothetical protein GOBAR_AA30985 [Gossypium barbadense]
MVDAIRALLTIDPWELFFRIIELTYLELTMELCSIFHLQTVMTRYDDLGTVQFRLGGLSHQLSVPEFRAALGLYTEEFREENELHALSRHIHFSPLKCWHTLAPSTASYNPSCSKASAFNVIFKRKENRRTSLEEEEGSVILRASNRRNSSPSPIVSTRAPRRALPNTSGPTFSSGPLHRLGCRRTSPNG